MKNSTKMADSIEIDNNNKQATKKEINKTGNE